MKDGRSRRRLWNVKMTSRYHIRGMGWWVIVCIIQIFIMDLLVYHLMKLRFDLIVVQEEPVGMWDFFAQQNILVPPLFIIGLALTTAILCLAAFTAHRMTGPYLALKRTLTAINKGDLACRLRFRDYDDLDDLAKMFNDMMDMLVTRAGKQGKPASPETADRKP